VFDNYYLDRRIIKKEQETVVDVVEEAPKTIAVLPFLNLSSDPEQEYFADGLSEELLNSLAHIPGLNVTGRTSSFSFKGSNKTVQEIADVLGVENILEGSVRKAGRALRITAQLLRAADGFHLWSETYDRELKDIFDVQEDIAQAVADELKATLGIGSLKQLGGTDNAAAYELYLVARGQVNNLEFSRALGSIEAALLLDPEFALAYALKAQIHNSFISQGPANRIAAEQDAALQAAQKAIELAPNLAEAHYVLGMTKTLKGNWIEAELSYQKAIELTTDPSSLYKVEFGVQYECLGDFEKAKENIEAYLQNDPLNQIYILHYDKVLTFLGDVQGFKEGNELFYKFFKELLKDYSGFAVDSRMFDFRLQSGDIVPKDEIPKEMSASLDAIGIDLESPEKSLAAIRQLYAIIGEDLPIALLTEFSIYAAYFGDPELVMDIIEKAGIQYKYAEAISNLWFPVMKEVRQTPRFKKYVREAGLVDYWNEFGWPDICRPLDSGDFECD